MSKEMIAKYSKDADDFRRMVDRLSSELQEVKAQLVSPEVAPTLRRPGD